MIPGLVMIVFTAVDLGRTAQYQNRMLNAAREGAAIAQFSPTSVDSGCRGDRNIVDRTIRQNPGLAGTEGFSITVAKRSAAGTLTPYTGCGNVTGAVTFAPGDHVVITIRSTVRMTGPVTYAVVGRKLNLVRSLEVVVQG